MRPASLPLRTQLALAFGLMTALVVVVALTGWQAMNRNRDAFVHHVEVVAQRAITATEVLDAADARAIAARNLLLLALPQEVAAEEALVRAAHARVQTALQKLETQLPRDDSEMAQNERRIFAQVRKSEQDYGPVALEIVRLATHQAREEAIARLNNDCRPMLKALLAAVNDYRRHIDQVSQDSIAQAQTVHDQRRNAILAVVALAMALAVGLAMFVVRSILRALGAEPSDLAHAARRVAQGDLGTIAGAAAAPSGSVLATLGDMQAQLAQLVGQVRQASDAIATGSAEIATGNSDLSQRTEQQASNLEETAASMEEMAATVKHNADTAQQATQLSASAAAAATQGGEVVGQVIGTMDGISASSRKIADIIGVIDGIAFQTNILALNAAVEAARAGEQGRGFAVVAGEVRTLAQRSATAAREIKSLINDSVERVDAGSRLVQDAGRTMDDIVTQIRRVNDLIAEISSATTEQTAGIGQISAAVNDLDRVTQQNAALVEQSAASAESLRQQATRLTEMVSVFRVGSSGSSSALAAAPRRAASGGRPASPRTAPARSVALASLPATPRAEAAPASAAPAADGAWETF